jgi:hypothetical protein
MEMDGQDYWKFHLEMKQFPIEKGKGGKHDVSLLTADSHVLLAIARESLGWDLTVAEREHLVLTCYVKDTEARIKAAQRIADSKYQLSSDAEWH